MRGRHTWLSLAVAAAIASGAHVAWTQQTREEPAPGKAVKPEPRDVTLTAEQRNEVKRIIITEMKFRPPPEQNRVPTKVGEKIPSGVPVQPIPVEVSAKIPELKTHGFVVRNGTVLIVDPKDNTIAELIR